METKMIIVEGGCTQCPEHHSTYDTLWVEKDKIVEYQLSTVQFLSCKKNCGNTSVLPTMVAKLHKDCCVIKEHTFDHPDGSTKVSRQLISDTRYNKNMDMVNIREVVYECAI